MHKLSLHGHPMQIYACMRAYRRVHAYMHICADMHICTHICIHAHIFAHICIHKCIYAYMCTYLYEKLTQHLTVAWVSSVDVKYTRQKSRPYLPNSMNICVFVVAHVTHGLRNRASSQIRSNCDKTCTVSHLVVSTLTITCNPAWARPLTHILLRAAAKHSHMEMRPERFELPTF